MKYALLIYGSKSMRREDLNEEQLREIYDGYSAVFAIPGVTGGTQLHGIETATRRLSVSARSAPTPSQSEARQGGGRRRHQPPLRAACPNTVMLSELLDHVAPSD